MYLRLKKVGGTGGKRRSMPSRNDAGKEQRGHVVEAKGGASQRQKTLGLSVQDADGVGSSGQEESGSTLAPVTMCFSMRCDDPSALAGRKAALEAAVQAALQKVAKDFGGRGLRVDWTRVGPSKDTLQRVLPMVLDRVGPAGGVQCFLVCKSWRSELEERGLCSKTVQLCSAIAEENVEGWDRGRLGQNAKRRLDASSGETERAMCLDANTFLQRWNGDCSLPRNLHLWLQAASQEPDASFFSRGAASTAQALGLLLVQWVGKPQGRDPGSCTLAGHSDTVKWVGFYPDGKLVVTVAQSGDLVKIWNSATGAEVSILE